jgi:hypothetical protein
MQTRAIAEVESEDVLPGSLVSLLDSARGEMIGDDCGPRPFSSFKNMSGPVSRVVEERYLLTLSELIVDVRPVAQMSEWSSDLDDEARAIHEDLRDASLRALGDD